MRIRPMIMSYVSEQVLADLIESDHLSDEELDTAKIAEQTAVNDVLVATATEDSSSENEPELEQKKQEEQEELQEQEEQAAAELEETVVDEHKEAPDKKTDTKTTSLFSE